MNAADPTRPDWVSDELFPFDSRFFLVGPDRHMHHVDEGTGPPIVMVHGNPSWSFEFRHLIAGLRGTHRCIAMDHIGFGLSSRSPRREDHHPRAHARNLITLLEALDVRDVTLFLTDWGGPIGLEFARKHPDRVNGLVVANSWSWPVSRDFHFIQFSWMMSSWLGRYLITRHNIFVNRVMPMAVGNKAVLTREVMEHYRKAQPPGARAANAALPGHIVGATDWLRDIWSDRARFIDKPALIFWGMKDIAFRKKELDAWKAALSDVEVHVFEDCGHFLAEEAPERIRPPLKAFIDRIT